MSSLTAPRTIFSDAPAIPSISVISSEATPTDKGCGFVQPDRPGRLAGTFPGREARWAALRGRPPPVVERREVVHLLGCNAHPPT